MKRRLQKQLIFLLFLLFSLTLLQNFIRQRSKASLLQTDTCFTEKFRQQALPPSLYAKLEKVQKEDSPKSFADLLTSTMLHGDFLPDKLSTDNEHYLQFKPEDYYLLKAFMQLYGVTWKHFRFPRGHPETFPGKFIMKTPLELHGHLEVTESMKAAIFSESFPGQGFIL